MGAVMGLVARVFDPVLVFHITVGGGVGFSPAGVIQCSPDACAGSVSGSGEEDLSLDFLFLTLS